MVDKAGCVFVKLVLDGAAEALLPGGPVWIGPGTGIIWQAAHPIPCRLAADATWWQWLHVDLRGCDAVAVELITRGHQRFHLPFTNPAVRELLALRGKGEQVDSLLTCSAGEAARLCARLLGAICDNLRLAPEANDPLVARISAICRERGAAGQRFNVAEIARLLGLSSGHLARRFRQVTGGSIGRHLRTRLLEEAHRQVLGSSAPVAEIAAALGYRSAAHFTQAFRRQYGCTPSALREA